MALDRWVALVLLGVCLAYGYSAWFTMDASMPPIMRRLAVWSSSFPKVLSVVGIVLCLIVLSGIEKGEEKIGDIDYRRLNEYKLGQALMLLGLMVALCIAVAYGGVHSGDERVSHSGFSDLGRTPMDHNDRRCGDCHLQHLVSGARGAGHLPAPLAVLFGGLIHA